MFVSSFLMRAGQDLDRRTHAPTHVPTFHPLGGTFIVFKQKNKHLRNKRFWLWNESKDSFVLVHTSNHIRPKSCTRKHTLMHVHTPNRHCDSYVELTPSGLDKNEAQFPMKFKLRKNGPTLTFAVLSYISEWSITLTLSIQHLRRQCESASFSSKS